MRGGGVRGGEVDMPCMPCTCVFDSNGILPWVEEPPEPGVTRVPRDDASTYRHWHIRRRSHESFRGPTMCHAVQGICVLLLQSTS